MKHIKLFSMAASMLLVASCTNDEVLIDEYVPADNRVAIAFDYNLPGNATRTSLTAQTGFPVGSAMAVEGFQTDALGAVYTIFNNHEVTYVEENGKKQWTYAPERYWDIASTYKFYAMYPYEVSHTFDADKCCYTITDFVVADAKDDQVDVMIAEENKALPMNLVTFNFNHLLSNINFYLKASSNFNTDGIESIELVSFDLFGVKNTGTYQQTGFNPTNKNVQGAWTVAEDSPEYDFPEVTTASVSGTQIANISTDLLLLPQDLTGVTAKVSYLLKYAGGSESKFSSVIDMARITGRLTSSNADERIAVWKPNFKYNYYMAVDPSHGTISDYDIDDNGSINEDGKPEPDHHVVVDEDGNYWVDEDGDGEGDVPIVWEDIDGDGNLEGGVDKDGDGHIDNVDGEDENHATPGTPTHDSVTDGDPTNNPDGKDVILLDKDGDGECETQLEKTMHIGPEHPEQYPLDWDGSVGGDGNCDENAHLNDLGGGEYSITVLEEGVEKTYPCVWEDLDGDGRLELGIDRDGDGKIDNVDTENENHATPDTPTYDAVSDGNTQANPAGRDVILVDTDGDGIAETQIEKWYDDPNTSDRVIRFSATIEDWEDAYEAELK